MTKTKTYAVWRHMRERCQNRTHQCYNDYGGRGISVCIQWEIFTNFLLDMGEVPTGRSIDRIDNDGDYCPKNCRWATQKQQCRNRRYNRFITYNGKTATCAEFAEIYGVDNGLLWGRIFQRGWDIERALNIKT